MCCLSRFLQHQEIADEIFVSCGPSRLIGIRMFRQLWVFGSLLSNFFIDDFAARQYKNCVRILKGSYIVKKCSDNKE